MVRLRGFSASRPGGPPHEGADTSVVAAAFGRLKPEDRDVLWAETETSVGNATYRVGSRLLVSGEDRWGNDTLTDPIAWYCGFTRTYSPTMADEWRQTFTD